MIPAEQVSELRRMTGAGLMDAKRALEEASGDMEKAAEILRVKGQTKAASRAGRTAEQGVVTAYTHGDRIGALVEVNCETDFVARSELFREFAHEIALQVVAGAPRYISPEDVPEEVVEKERRLSREEAAAGGKPEAVLDQIAGGRVEKFYGEHCLLRQAYVKDPGKTIGDYLHEVSSTLGEKISIRRFARFELSGE